MSESEIKCLKINDAFDQQLCCDKQTVLYKLYPIPKKNNTKAHDFRFAYSVISSSRKLHILMRTKMIGTANSFFSIVETVSLFCCDIEPMGICNIKLI